MAATLRPLSADEIRSGLAALEPEIPWTHQFNLGGVETITREGNEKFYNKSVGLKVIVGLALTCARIFAEPRGPMGMRVLDLASAEGGMSIAFAQAGAAAVLGIEGRQLYVNRSNFVAQALDVPNVKFMLGDVRKIDANEIGEFDLVIASGILHHLGQGDYWPFLKSIAQTTKGTLFLYTHVSTPEAVRDFRLQGPVKDGEGTEGYLFREHSDAATPEERVKQVRASLDNTFSFWATEASLTRALIRVGFKTIVKAYTPHPFSNYMDQNRRAVFLARK